VVREYQLVDNRSTTSPILVTNLVVTLRFGAWWKRKHYGSAFLRTRRNASEASARVSRDAKNVKRNMEHVLLTCKGIPQHVLFTYNNIPQSRDSTSSVYIRIGISGDILLMGQPRKWILDCGLEFTPSPFHVSTR